MAVPVKETYRHPQIGGGFFSAEPFPRCHHPSQLYIIVMVWQQVAVVVSFRLRARLGGSS